MTKRLIKSYINTENLTLLTADEFGLGEKSVKEITAVPLSNDRATYWIKEQDTLYPSCRILSLPYKWMDL